MWQVSFTSKAEKQAKKMPAREQDILKRLVRDLQLSGPVRPDWKNYSKLGDRGDYHCHLSYKWVACWRVENHNVKLIEVYYAGSRESAPY